MCDSLPVRRCPLPSREHGARPGNRRSAARIDDLDPVGFGRTQHDRSEVQGALKIEPLGVLQVAAVGSQGRAALREAGEREAAVGAGDAKVALRHCKLAPHPRQTEQPHAGYGSSFRIDGSTRDGEAWTEFDHRRHLAEALERRRRPGDVRDEDRGAFPLGHRQAHLATSARNPKAQRFG